MGGYHRIRRTRALSIILIAAAIGMVWQGALAVPISPRSRGASYIFAGQSPTTGLTFTGEVRPILVQLSNTPDARPQWGLSLADIVYEIPYWGAGHTDYLALYSDAKPDMVGPVRIARLHSAQLREEWGCAFAFWGARSDVYDFLTKKGVASSFLFDGSDAKQSPAFGRTEGEYTRASPNNAVINLRMLSEQYYPQSQKSMANAYSFNDMTRQGDDSANAVHIQYADEYHPFYIYDRDKRIYERGYDNQLQVDGYTRELVTASNVVVLRMNVAYQNGISSQPIYEMIGGGLADFFIDGRYIRGSWSRASSSDHTLFFDDTGDELQLLPGKTFIQVVQSDMRYTYIRDDGSIVELTGMEAP